MFIRNSRRSYRTYSYVEIILITDLCAFRTPVGVTELMLMLRSLNLFGGTRRYHRDYGTYTGNSEHILVLRNLYWSYGTYTGLTELILVLRNLYLYTGLILILRILYWYYRTYYCISDTEVPVGTTEHFTGTKVPVGTTEQIPYTEVLVGTTGLILILRIREYS